MSNRTKGSLLMVMSSAAFAIQQLFVATSADGIPLFEQLFFRNLFAAIYALPAIKKAGANPFGKRENRKLLLLRSIMGYLGMVCLFYASARAAQGDVAVLSRMSPFIVTLLAVVFLGEKIARYHVVALVLSFSGAVVVSNPTFNSDLFPLFMAMLCSIFSGVAYTIVGALKGREAPCVVVFFFSAFSSIVTAVLMIRDFVVPSFTQMLMLIGIGVFAAIGQMTLTQSYALADASEVSIFNYSGIPCSMLLGYVVLRQNVKWTSLLGTIMVVLAAGIVLVNQKRENQSA